MICLFREILLAGSEGCEMDMSPKEYQAYVQSKAKKSPIVKDTVLAFIIGGAICVLGQAIQDGWAGAGLDKEAAGTATSCTLVFLSALLTGLNVYNKLGRFGGAGTGCRTEVLLFNPEEKYASPVSRLRYADSCRLLLRQFGIVMREVEETDGTDGRPHLRDKNTP